MEPRRLTGLSQPNLSPDVLEIRQSYAQNRSLLEQIRAYAQPPHDPVPVLPGQSRAEIALFVSDTGIAVVNHWLRAFRGTLSSLDRFDQLIQEWTPFEDEILKNFVVADFESVIKSQEVAVGALGRSVCTLASMDEANRAAAFNRLQASTLDRLSTPAV